MKALDVMKKKRLEQSREVREQEGHLQRARDHRNKAEQVRVYNIWVLGCRGVGISGRRSRQDEC
jgi:hypothetical protein